MKEYLKHVKTGGRGKGKMQLIDYLSGKKIGRRSSIEAKCYDCMGHYVDGVSDCEDETCPLYPFNPYGNGIKKVGGK